MEALAGLAVGLLVVIAGLGIAGEAIRQIMHPQAGPLPFTLGVLVVVVVVKEAMYRKANKAARAARSNAGRADAWHHRADALTSLFAFVGISIAVVGGPAWAPADDWAALLASLVITCNGLWLMRGPVFELTDRHAPEVAELAEELALGVEGILAIERCEARQSGRGYRVVMHAEVDPLMSVADSHSLTGLVKHRIRERFPEIDSVLIHIEPHLAGISDDSGASSSG
jgi:cation diffusion facilitator family transporter